MRKNHWRRRLYPLGEMSHAGRQFWTALFVLALLGVFAVAYYYYLEGQQSGYHWSFIDALYMAIVVVTTIGSEPHPLSQEGRLFTAFFGGLGVGVVFALLIPSATSYLVSQQFSQQFQIRRRLRALQQLSEHYIVCGYGRMGKEAVTQLRRRGLQVAVIEQDEQLLEDLRDTKIPYVVGNATHDEYLRAVGLERAKGLIAAVGTDEDNVFIVLSARLLNPALFIVARAEPRGKCG